MRNSTPSLDGSFVASLQRSRLLITSAATRQVIQSWPLGHKFVARCTTIRWSHSISTCDSTCVRRILLADHENVRVFDLENPQWQASLSNASGNLSSISDAVFGHSMDDVLVFSDFGVKVTIWSLVTSRGHEVREPKSGVACYDIRHRTGHLAILTRAASQDTIVVLTPKTRELVWSTDLGTIDAQEIRWSCDGQWLAVRDIASVGHRVYIYTADGHLFRTFNGLQDPDRVELGIKSLQWSTAGTLLIGDYNGNVTILSRRSVSAHSH